MSGRRPTPAAFFFELQLQGGPTMKILFFDDHQLGVLNPQGRVVSVMEAVRDVPRTGPHNLISGVIERWDQVREAIAVEAASRPGVPLTDVHIRAPLPRPTNIDCMAVNYMEDGTRSEPAPINAFHKSPNCIIGPQETMVLPDIPASIFEGEAEIALVIGKRASHVGESEAMDYVFGYVNFIDGSARGLQPANQSFYQMKSRDTFAPLGPFIVTADEIADPQNLRIRLWVNGQLMQDFSTSDMAHSIRRCIAFVSAQHALQPGDIIATGTNHRGLNPLMDGDVVELECEGLGRLRIGVRDELKRTWKRETRLDRQNQGLSTLTPQVSGKYSQDPD
jgi:2-keto-4-pentenoate hydratase/2-oxohepta-3-ene-1,7-dioic acid hydratase in catechol pathway